LTQAENARSPTAATGSRSATGPATIWVGDGPRTQNGISANGANGILISGAGTTGDTVITNLIGVTDFGAPQGNRLCGVALSDGASQNTIGEGFLYGFNLIEQNDACGVRLTGTGTSGNSLARDYIADNNGPGVLLENGADNNTVGGTHIEANEIIRNQGAGVLLSASGSGNLIESNAIGTDKTGTQQLGNLSDGIAAQDGSGPTSIGDQGRARSTRSPTTPAPGSASMAPPRAASTCTATRSTPTRASGSRS
jgi:hypothetical protein